MPDVRFLYIVLGAVATGLVTWVITVLIRAPKILAHVPPTTAPAGPVDDGRRPKRD